MMISAGEAAGLRRDIERTWAETADVYVRGAGGQYTSVQKAGLRCSLELLNRQNTASMADRAELAAGRVLKWEAAYEMPANAQLMIGGRRWQFAKDTITLRTARPGSEPLYWMADVLRVP